MASEERFEDFFRANWTRLVHFVHRRVLDHAAAQDLAQDCFVEVFRQFSRGTPPTVAWVYGMARNRVKQFYRRLGQEASLRGRLAAEQQSAFVDDVTDMLEDALAGLGDAEREVLKLFYVDGLSAGETGALLGLSEQAVWKRLSRARRSARQLLQRSMNHQRGWDTE